MRIWKRLLGTALCLCAAVCVMSVSASAAEHSHPICGETHTGIGDHTGTCDNVTWIEVTKKDVTEGGELKLEDGKSYYLGEDIEVKYDITIKGTVNLCLNGKTLNSQYTVIEVKGGATLNICDCHGGGEITNTSESNSPIQVNTRKQDKGLDTATLNLYGGEVSGSVKNGGFVYDDGVIMLYNNKDNDSATAAVFNMYGGEVHNNYNKDSGGSAVYASYSGIGTGYFKLNMYGGSVTCEKGNGFQLSNNKNITMQITGGTVTGGGYGVNLNSNNELTLSGSAAIIGTGAGIYLPPDSYFTVKNGFAVPKNGSISVMQALGTTNKGVIAKPEGNGSLADRAQYFVSAEEGYFVESNSNGDLQLTACAITKQPAVNDYTVTANGGDKATYQWYSVTKDDVPVTSKNATTKDFSSGWDVGEWSYVRRAENSESVTLTAFALHMSQGDMLKLTEAMGVEGFSLADSNNKPVNPVESSRMSCTYAAPADDEYTLTVTAMPRGEYLMASFTATVTADVPDTALTGQVNAALDTSHLETGSYICKVTWENKTTRNSQAVSCAAAPSHAHSWSSEWTSDATRHWHDCENANCPVTENSGKSGYAEHSGGAANCTQQAVCTICGTAYGALDANGHDWGEWIVTKPATTSAAGEETRTCKRDKSHTETRAIPKLTPAPSGGGSSSAPAITVPVSGSGDTVQVSASVSGSTAEVKEIKRTELDKIGTDSAVVIDLSGLNKGVTGVTLSTDTIDSICKTEADGVTVKLPSAELRVDRQTLAAVTEQAAGSKIRLVVEPDGTARSTMTAAQRSALDGMRNAAVLEAYFVSDGTRIHDFKGGSVELSIPYQASGALRAWFLKEDGTREPVSARYGKENALLILHHFSHYVIEELDSSAAYTVCAKDDSCPLGAFGDLTAAAWYHDGVHYCLENGLMRGVSGGKFLPDGSTTRAQLVTVLWRLEGSPETTGAVRFGDTAGGAWYTEAVRWAAGCGVVKGYDNGCFGPNDAVTREQMAAILYRYAQHKGYDVSAGEDTNILSFNDAFAVSEYAIPAMQWACGSGMVRGIAQKGGMLLAPRDTTTRAQAATLIMRFQSAFAKEP